VVTVRARAGIALVVLGCAAASCGPPRPSPATPSGKATTKGPDPEIAAHALVDPPSEAAAPPVLVRRASVWTATGERFEPGYVLIEDGRIAAVGAGDGPAPKPGTDVVDAPGKIVTPGIIDPHSHMGVYAEPRTVGHDDGNEATDPVTAGLWAEHSFWPQDPALERAAAGGVTTIGVLPGSANLIGGRGVTMHLLPQRGARAMRFPGAPEIVKMACGENPKRVYGSLHRSPTSRMANLRALREAFLKAQKYAREQKEHEAKGDHAGGDAGTKDAPKAPDRDLGLETLALVLRGSALVQWHCYQADDMLSALQVADEFGFEIRSFHHALEAYKIRDVLAKRGIAVSTWDDWWGFKMEAYDGIPENLALFQEAGGRAAVHSDSPIAIQILNQAAGKALAAGRAAGVSLTENDALRWLTANPAWVLGIDDQVGTLERGKRADLVVWSASPFSTYARAERVYIDGHLVIDRAHPSAHWSDFEVGEEP
jgi:imidazolonepropionase-like amidohydrolase